MRISFHLPIIPPRATSQTAGKRIVIRDGKPMFFKNKQAMTAEHDLTLLFSQYAPPTPLEGPIELFIETTWPWRKCETKRRRAMGRVPHTTKPDVSNMVKMLEDCMTRVGFWPDDAKIASLHASKYWGDRHGIRVVASSIY